jgi:3-dehydroquinate synthase
MPTTNYPQIDPLIVDLGDRSYSIFIGSQQLAYSDLSVHINGKQVLIVSNETVAPLYLETVTNLLHDKHVDVVVLPDGEQYKNLDTLNLIFTKLLEQKHDRGTTLIALGGGVIGDMTGFAAATYQRGVAFIQIPTTLLSQVDSSVGGKTGVNHVLGKNMLGAFYQPKAVIIDTQTLDSLPQRQFSAGMAEVIKYGLISDYAFLQWLEQNNDSLLNRNPEALRYAIERSCINKAKIVSADETEQGVRAILNLGHTFGHAIETFQQYQGSLHGEAVAIGTVIAAHMSHFAGWLSKSDLHRIQSIFRSFLLPVTPPVEMTSADFLALMGRDKKVMDGRLRLVLLKGLGQAFVSSEFSQEDLELALNNACGEL